MKALKYLKEITKGIKHSDNDFYSHCYNVFKILEDLKQPKHVCLAGLYHSIYDTDAFSVGISVSREEIKKIIGQKAERLVWLFCNLRNKENHLLDAYPDKKELFYIAYANMLEQQDRLIGTDIKYMIKKYEAKIYE